MRSKTIARGNVMQIIMQTMAHAPHVIRDTRRRPAPPPRRGAQNRARVHARNKRVPHPPTVARTAPPAPPAPMPRVLVVTRPHPRAV